MITDYEGLADLARAVYRYTDCGAQLVAEVEFCRQYDSGDPEFLWTDERASDCFCGDELRQWGTWASMTACDAIVLSLQVTSIVEGSDAVAVSEIIPVPVVRQIVAALDPARVGKWRRHGSKEVFETRLAATLDALQSISDDFNGAVYDVESQVEDILAEEG